MGVIFATVKDCVDQLMAGDWGISTVGSFSSLLNCRRYQNSQGQINATTGEHSQDTIDPEQRPCSIFQPGSSIAHTILAHVDQESPEADEDGRDIQGLVAIHQRVTDVPGEGEGPSHDHDDVDDKHGERQQKEDASDCIETLETEWYYYARGHHLPCCT